ncbi:MAG: YkvA family protein [Bacillota bacterium]
MSKVYFFLKLLKYLKDKNVKWTHKVFFILPFLYAVSPITIIPYYFFPLAGLLDNIFVLLAGIYYIKKTIDDYDPNNSNKDSNKKKDNVIDINRDDYDVN